VSADGPILALRDWWWWNVWRRERSWYPHSGVVIVHRTLLGRWTWKRVQRAPSGWW
jgi:hypothetical protein